MTAEEKPIAAEPLEEIPAEEGPLGGNVSLTETIPTAGLESEKAPAGMTPALPEGGVVVGEMDLECLGSAYRRIEIGLHKETGDVAVRAVGFDDPYQLTGLIHAWCHPEQIIGNLNRAKQGGQ